MSLQGDVFIHHCLPPATNMAGFAAQFKLHSTKNPSRSQALSTINPTPIRRALWQTAKPTRTQAAEWVEFDWAAIPGLQPGQWSPSKNSQISQQIFNQSQHISTITWPEPVAFTSRHNWSRVYLYLPIVIPTVHKWMPRSIIHTQNCWFASSRVDRQPATDL